jgi:hypothetical protein
MEDFKEALSLLLLQHGAKITVEEEEGFLSLNIECNDEHFTVDTGYRNLEINIENVTRDVS